MKKTPPPLYIQLADLERAASSPVGPYLDGLVITDALNRGWILDSDARVVLQKAEAEWAAECRRRSDFDAWTKNRQARKSALAQKVRDKMGGGGTPESSARIQQAVWEALREFDEREPELDYYRWLERSPMSIA
jgi:predicted nucleic acid-binding Zn ribbon protein